MAKMADISNRFRVLAAESAASRADKEALCRHFENATEEYLELIDEATNIELEHADGQYLRFWGPSLCIEMDVGYGMRKRMGNIFPIGDDGGGRVIFYGKGKNGQGLHFVGYGDLDIEDATFFSTSLEQFLRTADGIEKF